MLGSPAFVFACVSSFCGFWRVSVEKRWSWPELRGCHPLNSLNWHTKPASCFVLNSCCFIWTLIASFELVLLHVASFELLLFHFDFCFVCFVLMFRCFILISIFRWFWTPVASFELLLLHVELCLLHLLRFGILVLYIDISLLLCWYLVALYWSSVVSYWFFFFYTNFLVITRWISSFVTLIFCFFLIPIHLSQFSVIIWVSKSCTCAVDSPSLSWRTQISRKTFCLMCITD